MVSFIDPGKVRHKRDPGRCYDRAGFVKHVRTQGGLVAKQMPPAAMPPPAPLPGSQPSLFTLESS